MYYDYYNSPIGKLQITASNEGILSIVFQDDNSKWNKIHTNQIIEQFKQQLSAYFDGTLTTFDVPIILYGTDFQKKVWNLIYKIPQGSSETYLTLANKLNNPKSVRAIGAAVGSNSLYIVIPCHRVIGTNGKLTGYGGGLWRKEWLLKHEGVNLL